MPGARQKPPDQLVNRRGGRGRALTVVEKTDRSVPAVRRGVSKYAAERWRAFWKSDVSHAVETDSDIEKLTRWIEAVSERERYWQLVKENPVMMRRGEMVKNPLWTVIRQLDQELDRAEQYFGMSPLSRFRLQFTKTEAESSLEDLMRKLSRPRLDELEVPTAEVIDLDELEG